ncbi:MAG TPA: hypothetical protein VFZ09_01410 [Archangium sp.]|uniref:hypothetical protein n=1 Tax=Archangium sp. TaxID=1872627 RepID=UPI002E32A3D0|nr:hypothetical protein [Archangium sp.]HEX5744867.1 hypothetical protein [Archangium sp.]
MMRSPTSLDIEIRLPPGRLSGGLVREVLELALRRFRWFEARRYGYASMKEAIDPAHLDLAPLIAYYEEHGWLCVGAKTDRDFIWFSPARGAEFPYIGEISWTTSVRSASKAAWSTALVQQVAELMRLVQSPLAQVGMGQDFDRKTRRWIPQEVGELRVITVRDYSEGLAGLFWRNFYGPPFVRMFGERLDSLPAECRQPLGEDLVLVQPYELPTEAGTASGIARERELISLLGPECFYDHEHHTLPSRRPVLDSLGRPLH